MDNSTPNLLIKTGTILIIFGLILLEAGMLSGCATQTYVPQVVKTEPCGATLDKSFLEKCQTPESLIDGSSFNDALNHDAGVKKLLRDCSIKVETLQKTLQSCKLLGTSDAANKTN